ncbi:MAG: dihydropteroate synthase, partial [Caulobacteraceae bacterium]
MSVALRPPGRPLVMGIVNVTPDSFSDGGLYLGAERAIAHG